MTKWMIVASAGILVGYILFKINLYIELRYVRKEQNDLVVISIYIFKRFMLYQLQVPFAEMTAAGGVPWFKSELSVGKEEVHTFPRREKRFLYRLFHIYLYHPAYWGKLMKKFQNYSNTYYYFVGRISRQVCCEKLRLRVCVGTEDAALTSLLAGIFWIIGSWYVTSLQQRICFTRLPQTAIHPQFGASCFTIDFVCILRLTIGDVITTTLSTANYSRKGAANYV